MKRSISIIMVFAMVLMFCCGCKSEMRVIEQQEPVEISFSWWGKDERNEYTIDAIEQFEKLYPEIKVNYDYSDWTGYPQRYNMQIESRTESDVMQINYNWLELYSKDGEGYYDLNELGDYVDLSVYTQDDLDYGMMNGKLNAVPIALNTMTVYINKTIYDKYNLDIPKSWQDFFEAAKVMNGEVYPLSMTSKPMWFAAVSYAEQLSGRQIMTQDGEICFEVQDIENMIDFYCEMVNNKVIPHVEQFDRLCIENCEYAGCMLWLSDADYVQTAIDNGNEYVVTDYPTNGTIGAGWYGKPATMYAISKTTEHPKEAALLLDYLINSEEMCERQGIEKGTPISSTARKYLEQQDALNGIKYSAFLEMQEYQENISILSFYFENEDIINLFVDSCNRVLYGKCDLQSESQLFLEQLINIISAEK